MPDFNPAPKSTPKPKRQPTPLKRTPLKPKAYTFKKPKPIAKVSAKRAALEAEKNKAYKVVTKTYCQGCGTSQFLSRSHTLPVSRNLSAIGDTRNIWMLCMDACHLHCEASRFYLLECGQEMVQNMLEIDYLAGLARIAKMRDRISEAGHDVSGMPDWVGETLKLLEN